MIATEDAFGARWAETAATEAAFELATGRHDLVYNGRRDAAWRARGDGVVELVRESLGRIELFEVFGDGTSRVIASSRRSLRVVAATACSYACFVSLFVGVPGAMFVSDAFFVLVGLTFLLGPLSFLLRLGSRLRPWVRARFGTDRDWADVPYRIEGAATTGSQTIALSALAQRSSLHYRVVDDGRLEVVKRGKEVEVLSMDHHGATSVVETRPNRRFDLAELRGPDVAWHEVLMRDPSD